MSRRVGSGRALAARMRLALGLGNARLAESNFQISDMRRNGGVLLTSMRLSKEAIRPCLSVGEVDLLAPRLIHTTKLSSTQELGCSSPPLIFVLARGT